MARLSDEERKQLSSKGGKARFQGWIAEQISIEMKRVRAAVMAAKSQRKEK
jgi:hypothetical protein